MKLTIVYDAELKTKRYVTMPTPFGSLPLKIRTGPMIIKGNDRNRNGETDQLSTTQGAVSYTHLRAHETVLDLVCRLLLEKKTKSPTTVIVSHR